jgi:hypothetical protein
MVMSALLPLVGVLLGAAGTVAGQYLATRSDARRDAARRASDSRLERKAAIVDFLAAVQRVEQYLDNRRHDRPTPPEPVDQQVHALWLAKKVIELVCGFDLSKAAHRYTGTLANAVRSPSKDAGLADQRATRADFMEAARRELGIPGARLYATERPESRLRGVVEGGGEGGQGGAEEGG